MVQIQLLEKGIRERAGEMWIIERPMGKRNIQKTNIQQTQTYMTHDDISCNVGGIKVRTEQILNASGMGLWIRFAGGHESGR